MGKRSCSRICVTSLPSTVIRPESGSEPERHSPQNVVVFKRQMYILEHDRRSRRLLADVGRLVDR